MSRADPIILAFRVIEARLFRDLFLNQQCIIKHSYFGRDLFHWSYTVNSITINLWSYAVREIIKKTVLLVNTFFSRKVTQKLLNHWL